MRRTMDAGFVVFGLAVSELFALAEREKRVLALIFTSPWCTCSLSGWATR